ncbi:MAG: hypothetical protein ACKO0Z_26020 [Betaproteobacteria bacterium]
MMAFFTATIELFGKMASAFLEGFGFGGAAGLSVLHAASAASAITIEIHLDERSIKTSESSEVGGAGDG